MNQNPLFQLGEHGQSVWLDSIQRRHIQSGELKQMIETMALRGETSNPSIFEKAIVGSSDYDAEIQTLAAEGFDTLAIYEKLATDDVRAACDVFDALYGESSGTDGFVSIEVSPRLAYDTLGTIQEAKRLWATVDRPNLMIKIPGTNAGVPAIEEAIYLGMNINVTLLFSVKAYAEVAWAYIRGLERRAAEGMPVNRIASVASFFVSRIDTLADKLLEPDNASLHGKLAIANAQIAYEKFNAIFAGERWMALHALGARVQRPLWASTSTKNPAYRDVIYVETLIGPHTVNTMPMETVKAFADHGVVARTVNANFAAAHDIIAQIQAAGVSLNAVTNQVLDEGVTKFDEAFTQLLAGIDKKTRA